MQMLEHVEGMNLAALRAGITWTFETFPIPLGDRREPSG